MQQSDITFDALVADAIAVMDAFGVARRHCGGICRCTNGAGGGSALRAERVSHLIIVDGMYSRGVPMDNDPFLQACAPRMAQPLSGLCNSAFLKRTQEHMLGAQNSREQAGRRHRLLADGRLDHRCHQCYSAHRAALAGAARRADQIVPLDAAKALVSRVARAQRYRCYPATGAITDAAKTGLRMPFVVLA